jgi:hypothetical protein
MAAQVMRSVEGMWITQLRAAINSRHEPVTPQNFFQWR